MSAGKLVSFCAIALGLFLVALPPWVFIVCTLTESETARLAAPGSGSDSIAGLALKPALNSLALALVTCAGCFVLGVPTAFALARARLGRIRWLAPLCLIPFLIPVHVHATAWIGAFAENGLLCRLAAWLGVETFSARGLYGFVGCALVMVLCYWPCVALTCATRLETLPRNLEEAARLHRGPLASILRVALPQALPAALAGMAIVFVLALGDMGASGVLWPKTSAFQIFTQFAAFYSNRGALAAAVPTAVLTVPVMLAALWLMGRLWAKAPTSIRTEMRYFSGLGGLLCCATLVAGIVASIIFPLSSLIHDTWSGSSFSQVAATFGRILAAERETLVWTALLAGLGALGCLVVGLSVAAAMRGAFAGGSGHLARVARAAIWLGFLLPLALPGMLVGLGLSETYNHRDFRSYIFASPVIVVLAYVARFGFIALAGCHQQLSVHAKRLSEAAAVHGVPGWRRFLRIDLPLGRRAFVTLWLLIFVLCLGELNATMMIDPPGLMMLPKRIANLIHYSYDSQLAALCLIMVLGILLVYVPAAILMSRRREK